MRSLCYDDYPQTFMAFRFSSTASETQKKRSLMQRMMVVKGVLFFALLIIVTRLLDLQILKHAQYHEVAQAQHYGGVVLPAKRGELLAYNDKTGETSVLATNTTLDLVYVDPLITDDPTIVAETLADILLRPEFHEACSDGEDACPRELIQFYAPAFDPLTLFDQLGSGTLLERLPSALPQADRSRLDLPDLTEARRLFARDIERRISKKSVTFVPLLYGATKVEMDSVERLGIPGVDVTREFNLISADPELVNQSAVATIARDLSPILAIDQGKLRDMLRRRALRYVPVMRRLEPRLSLQVKQKMLDSYKETSRRKAEAQTRQQAEAITDPLRSIALIPEHWRFYPDSTIASQVVGFLNVNQEAQYGIERTFDPQLRGQEGLIRTVSDPLGGQIATGEQTIINPKDGDTIVLSIDPLIQKETERILTEGVKKYEADSAEAIVMDPYTGRILAMANAPVFSRNSYSGVFDKEPIYISPEKEKGIVVEIHHPDTNARIIKGYIDDVFTSSGRSVLSDKTKKSLEEVEQLYDLHDLARYYLYIGENVSRELFPTDRDGVWLKYKNNLGVGAYLNRTIQAVYEPGSVMKPITMAIAIDQGEVSPEDIYNDEADVEVDEFTIKNALLVNYGEVTMTECLAYSINTCMTSVSGKLGKKLFHRLLERFGFARITGIELEDELPGDILPWRQWSNALLATASFGQGISATPLQMVTGFAALANGGKLLRPSIIHTVIHPDGTEEQTEPRVVDQVITPLTSETISAMLTATVNDGYAKSAKVPGYNIAGKTGTSQIAGPGGKYETGTGSTITSFIGYAPSTKPKFIALIKLNRPKLEDHVHGSTTAAPLFKELAAFLLKYYGIPPDER